MSDDVGYCADCGWRHANLDGCWRKIRREALAKLEDPALDPDIRARLAASLDALERTQAENAAFFRAVAE